MSEKFDLLGLGNAIVDIVAEVSENEFLKLGFEKASMRLVDIDQQKALIENFSDRNLSLSSGGSVANSVMVFSGLGGKAAFKCCIGDDPYGLHYAAELEQNNIKLGAPIIAGATTGTCFVLTTPDGERTMRTSLGVSGSFSQEHLDPEIIANSRWIFIEGYLLANADTGQQAVRRAVQLARQNDTKVAVTCSESWVIESFRDEVEWVIERSDLVFANELEAMSLSRESSVEAAFQRLCESCTSVVVTMGSKGALVQHGEENVHVPAFKCNPRDLTGAGDAFAGTFLYGLVTGQSAYDSARAGCFIASKVIEHLGARLQTGVKELWNELKNHETAH
ncbi:MAG: adenosine kinase [Candidatus Dadabacteria bacterium]|nr:MAG: adenosine kinase [Candidatus Dadabacteria bacterium]